MNTRIFKKITGLLLLIVSLLVLNACKDDLDSGQKEIGFSLINEEVAVEILVEGENVIGSTSGDYPGVVRAAYDLQEDIEMVTTKRPEIISSKEELSSSDYIIIVGSIEKSGIIKELAKNNKISISGIEDKWESYIHQLVDNPFGDGSVKTALVIAGSDKRGTIYGIYKISSLIGVSPWLYWADQEPNYLENYSFEKGYFHLQDEPTVQYRGIFLNDEEELSQWSARAFNGTRNGPQVYETMFELLLRLNANYIWPAMHATSDAFNDHEMNRVLADYFGIVIGTSHVDMMMRNNNNEWDSFVARYRRENNYYGPIEYDYTVNPEILQEYWRSAVRLYKDYEVQYSLGMRGKHDVPFTGANIDQAPYYGDNVKLLKQIIEDQRQILREELNNPTLEDVFMIFTPYKEVQDIYNKGMDLPDDITVLWVDDNHGFIRQLTNDEERARKGGSGVYYHNSYWGPDDESYMWLNSMSFTLMYEEMSKSIEYGAVKNWVLNVGDLKPGEVPMDFFLSYAYDADKYTSGNVYDVFVNEWAEREFGYEYIEGIKSILKRYQNYTNVVKLEHMKVDLFTNNFYSDEWEKRMSKYQDLLDDSEAIFEDLPTHKKAAFYEMILYQVRQAYYKNAEFYYADKAESAALYKASATAQNSYEMSRYFHELSHYENTYYEKVLKDGKWDGLLQPYRYTPPVAPGLAESGASLQIVNSGDVIVEGERFLKNSYELKFYNYAKGRKFIDVFNSGAVSFSFTASTQNSWIKLSQTSGEVIDEVRVWVEIDWDKAPKGKSEGEVVVTHQYGTKKIKVSIHNDNLKLAEKTYLEQDGYVSMELEHYSNERRVQGAYFETIKDLGRIEGDMVRAFSEYLVGYGNFDYLEKAPYLEYNVHFLSNGTFAAEVFRLPTLDANGKIRFAVQVDNNQPLIIEGENDFGVGNYDWEEGIFTQIFRHQFEVEIPSAGLHKIRIYMIDPFITLDKMVVYTEGKFDSYLGPDESYNSTFNKEAYQSTYYDPFYQTEFLVSREKDITKEWGEGYFVVDGKALIEAETATEQSTYAYTTNNVNDGWVISRNQNGYAMRTRHSKIDYLGQPDIAPTMNYQVHVTNPGNYNVWILYNAPMYSGDSFVLAVNNIERFRRSGLYSYQNEEVFVWGKAGVTGLTNGTQTINILASETGLVIDKIYLTKTSETPTNASVNQSVRTSNISNLNLKKQLLQEILKYKHIDNFATGTAVGTYDKKSLTTFYAKYDTLLALYNESNLLSSSDANTAISDLTNAYTKLLNSKITIGPNSQNYVLYEDFGLYQSGYRPFGIKEYHITGWPNIRVYNDGQSNYLAIRTLYEQRTIQQADLYYEFNETVDGEFVVETRASFNEAIWGNLVYLQDENRNEAVGIAFETSNKVNNNIVAYDGNTKRIIGRFERNEWIDIKVEVNTNNQTYRVYINGELATARDFKFRKEVTEFKYLKFGTTVAEANLQYQFMKVYRKDDFAAASLEEVLALINQIPQQQATSSKLVLPSVPNGYSIKMKSSSDVNVVDLDGNIKVPLVNTKVNIVFTITDLNTLDSTDTKSLEVTIPGVSASQSKVYLTDAIHRAAKDINMIPLGIEVGRYSAAKKAALDSLISEATILSNKTDLRYSEVLAMEERLIQANSELFASKNMEEIIDGVKYTYYALEDFDFYSEGSMPFGVTYLPVGNQSALIVKDGTNGLYKLVTGSGGQAYNRLDLTNTLSGKITFEIGVIHSTTASSTFGNLIFLMSDNSTTPVASIAFDRPGSITTLKYHDGTGWKTTNQVVGTNVIYQPGSYAVIRVEFDLDARSYDVYFNDILVYENIGFRNTSEINNIDFINFGTTKGNEEMYFDYIKVYSKSLEDANE